MTDLKAAAWKLISKAGLRPLDVLLTIGSISAATTMILVSFTPAYGLTCTGSTAGTCSVNLTNPCGPTCNDDPNGDPCMNSSAGSATIVKYQIANPTTPWPRCTSPNPARPTLSCGESPKSCGTPTYYYHFVTTGSGNNGNPCDPNQSCTSNLIWVGCAASSGSACP